jgi:hypothetical protein
MPAMGLERFSPRPSGYRLAASNCLPICEHCKTRLFLNYETKPMTSPWAQRDRPNRRCRNSLLIASDRDDESKWKRMKGTATATRSEHRQEIRSQLRPDFEFSMSHVGLVRNVVADAPAADRLGRSQVGPWRTNERNSKSHAK